MTLWNPIGQVWIDCSHMHDLTSTMICQGAVSSDDAPFDLCWCFDDGFLSICGGFVFWPPLPRHGGDGH